MQHEIHTVLGAGQVGGLLARMLADMGHQVRLVRRGPLGAPVPGIQWMLGDVTDAAFLDQACRGATAVYNCVNPPDYTRWEGVLEPLFDGVREGAARAGARLVVLDCLYMYGRPTDVPFDEDAPMRPCSRKGEMRTRLVERLFAAHARGDLEVTTGRAADFFGPGAPRSFVLSPDAVTRIHAGKRVMVLGDPELPRSYSYIPDVARGLAILGTRPEAVGRAWHLPVASQGTTRSLLERAFTSAGRTPRYLRVPSWVFHAGGWFSPFMGAAAEMLYQWEVPFLVDDRRFRATFDVQPTPLDAAVAATVGSPKAGAEPARVSSPA
jgi:nucleoside-diphosphate-sugar epimerase